MTTDTMRAAVGAMSDEQLQALAVLLVSATQPGRRPHDMDSAIELLRAINGTGPFRSARVVAALEEGGEPRNAHDAMLREVVRLYDDEPMVSSPRRAMWVEDFDTAMKKAREFLAASPTAAPKEEPALHPNHLPDLRYVLKVLQGAHVPERQHGDVQAAINGMRYIIKRTEEATRDTQGDAKDAALLSLIEQYANEREAVALEAHGFPGESWKNKQVEADATLAKIRATLSPSLNEGAKEDAP